MVLKEMDFIPSISRIKRFTILERKTMSYPIPTMEYTITEQDLKIYLDSIQKQANHYRANKIVHKDNPEELEYADKMLNKLDAMAVEAIARYHNQ